MLYSFTTAVSLLKTKMMSNRDYMLYVNRFELLVPFIDIYIERMVLSNYYIVISNYTCVSKFYIILT